MNKNQSLQFFYPVVYYFLILISLKILKLEYFYIKKSFYVPFKDSELDSKFKEIRLLFCIRIEFFF